MFRILMFVLTMTMFVSGHKYRGSIPLKNVGLLSTYIHAGSAGPNKYSILCSTYDKLSNTVDEIVFVDQPGRYVNSNFSGVKLFPIDGSYYWSKDVQQIAEKEFDMEAILIPDGCKINGKQKGRMSVANITSLNKTSTHDISTPLVPNLRLSYQYATAIFKQISLIGGKDILTCRASYDSGSYSSSELVYFKRPKIGSELVRPWIENILSRDACDGHFVEVDFKYSLLSRWEALYAINSHKKEINILWPQTENGTMGRWDEISQLKKLRLGTGRRYEDITAADLNKDGKVELIISVLSEWDGNGSLEIWRIPDDFRSSQNYTKIVVDMGFFPRVTGGSSPGVVKVFQPSTDSVGKPWIFLTGGDDGKLYYYTPMSQNKNDWRYKKNILMDAGAGHTISGFTVADVEGNGPMEVFISIHSLNRIDVYSLEM